MKYKYDGYGNVEEIHNTHFYVLRFVTLQILKAQVDVVVHCQTVFDDIFVPYVRNIF